MEDFRISGGNGVTASDRERRTQENFDFMKRPAIVRTAGGRIAAALITGVVAASFLLACSSTSKAPTVKPVAKTAVSSAGAVAQLVKTDPVRKAAVATDATVEKFPSPAPATTSAGTTSAGTAVKTTGHAYGCAAALAYLHAHAEPHFTMLCPAPAYNAQGGPAQAMTCVNHPPQCAADTGVIAISDPCPTAYMNEAANSWIALHLRSGAWDPYGPSC
jgi:hypothetical protein